jgi:hypothetical protein
MRIRARLYYLEAGMTERSSPDITAPIDGYAMAPTPRVAQEAASIIAGHDLIQALSDDEQAYFEVFVREVLESLGYRASLQPASPTAECPLCHGFTEPCGNSNCPQLKAPASDAVAGDAKDAVYNVVLQELEKKRRMPTSTMLALAITNAVAALRSDAAGGISAAAGAPNSPERKAWIDYVTTLWNEADMPIERRLEEAVQALSHARFPGVAQPSADGFNAVMEMAVGDRLHWCVAHCIPAKRTILHDCGAGIDGMRAADALLKTMTISSTQDQTP